MSRTADFRDINKNGIDDRDESSESREEASTSKEGVDQTQRGLTFFEQMQNQIFGRSEDPSDSLGRDLKLGYAYNTLGKGLDYQLTKGMGEFQSGLHKDNALFGADLELRNQRDARADEFGYGMRAMDKQFELQDAYQNREFGRNIGTCKLAVSRLVRTTGHKALRIGLQESLKVNKIARLCCTG